MSYGLTWLPAPSVASDKVAEIAVGICDDGQGSFLWLQGLETLRVRDLTTRSFREVGGAPIVRTLERGYRLKLVHGGATRVQAFRDDELLAVVESADRQAGGIFLWVHSARPVALSEIEVVGRFDDAARERFRDDWIRARISALGLAAR